MNITLEELTNALDGLGFHGCPEAPRSAWFKITWPQSAARDIFSAVETMRKEDHG